MKRITILTILVATIFSAAGQRYGYNYNRPYAYLGLTVGAGIGSMLYDAPEGNHTPGFGLDLGLHYTHFFSYFGFGMGMHLTSANAYTVYNHDEVTNGLHHADNPNAHYNLITHFDNWKERQHLKVVSLPIEFFYRTHVGGGRFFIAGAGVMFDIPVSGNYSAAGGTFTTSGVFPALGSYPVSDMPEHGFDTYSEIADAPIGSLKVGVGLLADIGMRLPLGETGGLYVGIYGSYGLSNILGERDSAPLLTIDSHNAQHIVYNGTYTLEPTEGSALHMLRAGVKIGIDLASPVDN